MTDTALQDEATAAAAVLAALAADRSIVLIGMMGVGKSLHRPPAGHAARHSFR